MSMSLHPGSSPFLKVWLMETKPYKLVEGLAASGLEHASFMGYEVK
jgi:hypothetical protein